MEVRELEEEANVWQEKLVRYYKKSKEELINIHALKLGEETGELFEQLLAFQNIQRKDKLDVINKEEIGAEIADVILCTTVLAKSLGINLEKELKNKINKNRERLN